MNFHQNFLNPFQFNLNSNNNIFNQPLSIFKNMNKINNFNNMNGLMDPNMIANNNNMNFYNNMNNTFNYNNQNQINNNLNDNQETTEYHINFKLDHDISYLIIEKNETEIKKLQEKFLIKIIIQENFSFPSIYEIQFLYKKSSNLIICFLLL